MQAHRTDKKWNGWGKAGKEFDFGGNEEQVWALFRKELGVSEFESVEPATLAALKVPEPRLSSEQLESLTKLISEKERVTTEKEERVFHARGRSTVDIVELRDGTVASFPDVVVYPRSTEEVQAVLRFASEHAIAVIPFGGGSSVVRGVQPTLPKGKNAVLTLDMTLMDQLVELDEESMIATFQAGIYGPELERVLGERGYTLGHTPQSFEYSTLGGWVAARGAGSQSNRYGKAEEMLAAARLVTPQGEVLTRPFPASAAGPDLNHLIAGSEGCLGVITEASMRVHPLPAAQAVHGFLFKSFEDGCRAVRQILQQELSISMLRLSDEPETRFFSQVRSSGGSPSVAKRLIKGALAAAGFGSEYSMMLVGLEGSQWDVHGTAPRLIALCAKEGGVPLGPGIGASWTETRYETPYLRDQMLDHGVFAETVETSTTWSNVGRLYAAVRAAIEGAITEKLEPGVRPFVMTHVSHSYHSGASLYFTFAYPRSPGKDVERFYEIKRKVMEAMVNSGGTLSHHHGVGGDHAEWMKQEKSELGLDMLRAAKARLDPEGVMNPGKWL